MNIDDYKKAMDRLTPSDNLKKRLMSEFAAAESFSDEEQVSGVEIDKRPVFLMRFGSLAAAFVLLLGIGSTIWLLNRTKRNIEPDVVKPIVAEITTDITTNGTGTSKTQTTTSRADTTAVTSAISAETVNITYVTTAEEKISETVQTASVNTTAFEVTESATKAVTETVTTPPLVYNELKAEFKKLENSIEVNGLIIPSGATELNIRIENNTGFDSIGTVAELGDGYSVISGNDNLPVAVRGSILGCSAVCAMDINNSVYVICADSDNVTADGTVFTLYLNENNSGEKTVTLRDIPPYTAKLQEYVHIDSADGQQMIKRFIYEGDTNENNAIDKEDAVKYLKILKNYIDKKYADTEKPNYADGVSFDEFIFNYYSVLDEELKGSYLETMDNDDNFIINTDDAKEILRYYLCRMNSLKYSGWVGKSVGYEMYN